MTDRPINAYYICICIFSEHIYTYCNVHILVCIWKNPWIYYLDTYKSIANPWYTHIHIHTHTHIANWYLKIQHSQFTLGFKNSREYNVDSVSHSVVSDSLWPGRLKPWRRQWHPTPVLLPGKSHGQRSLVGCSPWGR